MRLSILIEVDAVPPAAIERRAVPFAIASPREHRAPAFPLAPFLAHLAATWLPYPQGRTPQAHALGGAYRVPAARPRTLINRSV
jgi:hypothetical protein